VEVVNAAAAVAAAAEAVERAAVPNAAPVANDVAASEEGGGILDLVAKSLGSWKFVLFLLFLLFIQVWYNRSLSTRLSSTHQALVELQGLLKQQVAQQKALGEALSSLESRMMSKLKETVVSAS